MRRPAKLGTTLLSIFLVAYGILHILELKAPTAFALAAVLNIVAIAAGILIWLDR
jgi:hypothetical protein